MRIQQNGRPCYRYIRSSDKLPAIGQTAGDRNAMARVKLFDPCGSWTWYVSEHNPGTGECFGLVDGFEKELGYFDLSELQEWRGKGLGLPLERDLHFKPCLLTSLMDDGWTSPNGTRTEQPDTPI